MMTEAINFALRQKREQLRLPHAALALLTSANDAIKSQTRSRVWTLPQTLLSDEVSFYGTKHQHLSLRGPRPSLRQSVSQECAEEIATKVDSGLNFLRISEDADFFTVPILLYYAAAHILGAYTRAVFNWRLDRAAHGITCSKATRSQGVGGTRIKIQSNGLVPRFATTCFLLSGWPSLFSELVVYSEKPTAHTGSGEKLEHFGKEVVGNPLLECTLDELVSLDYKTRLNDLKQRHGYHKFEGLPTTAIIADLITLFTAGWLARYDVLGWRQILDGKTNSYRIHFEETNHRVRTFLLERVLASIADPTKFLSERIWPEVSNPYTDDHPRFRLTR